MPKVRLNTTYANPLKGCFRPGNTLDVNEDEAKDLISGGYAILVEEALTPSTLVAEITTFETEEVIAKPLKPPKKSVKKAGE